MQLVACLQGQVQLAESHLQCCIADLTNSFFLEHFRTTEVREIEVQLLKNSYELRYTANSRGPAEVLCGGIRSVYVLAMNIMQSIAFG
jgi:hypothetical protein